MSTVVKTAHGEVRGLEVDGVHAFLGMPFAAPVAGANRLRPPQPVESWDGVRNADRFGASPPQVAPPESAGTEWDTTSTGADCLSLNVWTPDPGAARLPVMVWIQGGAFEISSTAAYDGSRFARDGVVCVTINWRLGADGFLYLDDGIANLGLLDQVAALEWVRDNIGAFGGDPGNVTVFGESAGAMSIGTLLSMPRAEGLFRRAILQSGAAHHVLPAATAALAGRRLAEKLGVPADRDALAAVPVERLIQAQAELAAEMAAAPDPERWGEGLVPSMMPWQPTVDGDVVPAPPMERIAAGAGAQVDVLVGSNTEDWKMFLVITGELWQIADEMLTGPVPVQGRRSLAAFGLPVEEALAAYRSHYPGAIPGDLLAAVQTDWWIRIPALRLAETRAGANDGAGTYMYEFAWAAPGLGAVHALDVPFVFDTLGKDARLFGDLLGDAAPQQLADTMHAAWIAFATHGDPGWPRYDLDRRATMRFDVDSRVVDDPRAWERALWEGIR
ncbi:carboxylesterase/lipase family protein [Nocardioides mesophilus]|uniref:Carboxylic ester hydrolase n=1 Tax=Nocardioides mesophilus TaxID=433659 RepID=A0A7G9REG3_9ACTN|nr:carboxylesterase/lipase family protein [Nocardioides mesophilus]QNN53988.1 carboxylesterase/lipase family protein [Nocardioides mesophilus]